MRGIVKEGIYHKFEKEDGKLRKFNNAWSINLDEIYGHPINSFHFETDKANYKISYETAIAKGFKRVFGGENKLVVHLKNWEIISKK